VEAELWQSVSHADPSREFAMDDAAPAHPSRDA
jgi:hypothetical protein